LSLGRVRIHVFLSSQYITSGFSACLYQPPITLKPSGNQPEQDATEIAIVKLLIKSYYDIVRKNIEDAVPKAVMHFLVGLPPMMLAPLDF
jgi:hypothetical protein